MNARVNGSIVGMTIIVTNGPYSLKWAFILLNYRYSSNGRIGVNASIRSHSTVLWVIPYNRATPPPSSVCASLSLKLFLPPPRL